MWVFSIRLILIWGFFCLVGRLEGGWGWPGVVQSGLTIVTWILNGMVLLVCYMDLHKLLDSKFESVMIVVN